MIKRTLLILFVLTSLMFQSCKDDKQQLSSDLIENPTSYDSDNQEAELAKIKFEKTEYDFGQLIEGEIVKYAFKFTNVGKKDLLISNVHTSCGCTVGAYPQKAIAPGESDAITVKFDSGNRSGFQNKSITVATNGIPAKHILKIKAKVSQPTN